MVSIHWTLHTRCGPSALRVWRVYDKSCTGLDETTGCVSASAVSLSRTQGCHLLIYYILELFGSRYLVLDPDCMVTSQTFTYRGALRINAYKCPLNLNYIRNGQNSPTSRSRNETFGHSIKERVSKEAIQPCRHGLF